MDHSEPLTAEQKEYTVIAHSIMQICALCTASPNVVVDKLEGYLWSDEEAAAERNRDFPDLHPDHAMVVCDDCYREMMGLAPAEA